MSWPTWTATGAPIPTAMATPVQSTLLPTALNPAPAVIAPMGYSQEQWAQAQQQNWQQWAQWQQQYQQWHQQYGAEYQKSITAMQGALSATPVQPPLPAAVTASVAPPLPIENKPPLPPEEPALTQSTAAVHHYSSALPKTNQTGYTTVPPIMTQPPPQVFQTSFAQPLQNWQNTSQKRPHNQDMDYDSAKKAMLDKSGNQWSQQRIAQNQYQGNSQNYTQPPPQVAAPKPNVEELSEAEKKFDKEFAAWEAQFNKWKDQNANHPDKTQYKEYEKKWESWRNSLLERREQMRRKRLSLTTQTGTAITKPQTFNQPPPEHQTMPADNLTSQSPLSGNTPAILGQYPPTSQIDLFSKPPPTQNNEPLAFKNQTASLEEEGANSEEGFLKSSSSGGIPGLDLVKEDTREENLPDRSDIEEESENPPNEVEDTKPVNKGPDFEAISKGINTILGDQKLLSMLSMVSQNPPNIPVNTPNIPANLPNIPANPPNIPANPPNIPANPIATDTSVMPPGYGQNFAIPPPNHPKHPTGISLDPKSTMGESSYNKYSNQSYERNLTHENYPQSRENFGSFNQGDNRFSGPPPSDVKTNLNTDAIRNDQDNFNAGPFKGRDSFPRSSGSSENLNRIDQSYNRFDDNFQVNRTDNFLYGNRDTNIPKRNAGASSFIQQSSFNRDSFGKMEVQYGRSRNFNKDDDFDDYDNYNDEEDFDRYNDMFRDDEDQYQNKNKPMPQHPPPKIPALMDQIAPAPPHIQSIDEEPLFEPVTVIDYEHKSKREYDDDVTIEPNNMFDYRHKPLNRIPLPQRPRWLAEAVKFIREFDPMAARFERPAPNDRYFGSREEEQSKRFEGRERQFKHYERGIRNDKPYDRNDKPYDRDEVRKNDRLYNPRDRVKFNERDDFREENFNRSREERPKHKFSSNHSRESSESLSKKKEHSSLTKEDFEEFSDTDMDFEQSEQARHHQEFDIRKSKSKSPELSNPPNPSSNKVEITMIEDVINAPGRYNRPPRIVIILRGPPGSGKTFLAKQIKDKEVENGGSAPRILSLDDYFMVEQENKVLEDGKVQTVKEMVYEYEADMEESYRTSFMKSFRKTVTDGYFPFIIVDNVNDKVKHFGEMWSFAKQNGFQVYICQLDLDPVQCAKRNIHNRSAAEIEEIISGWEPTPAHHPSIDASGLLQTCAIAEVEMEVEEQQTDPIDEKSIEPEDQVRSKWDNFDCSSNNLAKLDGVNKPLRKSRTMEEYLQLEEQWEPPKSTTSGKKRVRWADLEEQRELEKMRAIGFVVGHTDWERMMDPTGGSRALTKTKYIERNSRY